MAQRTNVQGTAHLAQAAIEAGVNRFVFMSSALVLAGGRDANGVIRDATPPGPLTSYARTKLEAEQVLQRIASGTSIEWVILRPPMVYGPHAPGNFQRLLRLAATGLPLPFGRATALKSFLYVDNLLSAVKAALEKPEARNRSFLVADAEVTCTADLIRMMSESLGRPARVLSVPEPACRLAAALLGRSQDMDRLFDPLVLDTSEIQVQTGWIPEFTLKEGIYRTVQHGNPAA
jgi:nucleoside-diphosphate-sugar epimerase